ncbi:hypothetical protein Tco_0016883 [Tanacetum coccineum]
MSTTAYVNSESITQADGAQSSRVPVPLPDDPYVAIRQARLVDTESELEPEEAPFEAEELQSLGSRVPFMGEEFEAVEPSGTRTDSSHSSASSDSTTPLSPDHPLTHILPTPTPTRTSFHYRTARMTVCVQPAMSLGHSARVTEAMALSNSAFRKRYKSSYESPSSSLSPVLPVRKRYQGMSELILDTDSEGDELRDKDIKEDESLDADDEGERLDDKGYGLKGDGLGLEEEEVAPEGQQQAVPVVDTAVSEPLSLGYGAARRRALESIEEIAPSTYEVGQSSRSMSEQQGADRVFAFRQPILTTWVDPEDDKVYTDIPIYPLVAPVQTPLSPEWSSGSLPVSPSSHVVLSPISSLVAPPTATISDHTQRLDALPPTLVANIDRYVRELYTRSGVVKDEIFSQRPMLALEAWARHVDTQLADTSRDRRGAVESHGWYEIGLDVCISLN